MWIRNGSHFEALSALFLSFWAAEASIGTSFHHFTRKRPIIGSILAYLAQQNGFLSQRCFYPIGFVLTKSFPCLWPSSIIISFRCSKWQRCFCFERDVMFSGFLSAWTMSSLIAVQKIINRFCLELYKRPTVHSVRIFFTVSGIDFLSPVVTDAEKICNDSAINPAKCVPEETPEYVVVTLEKS